ncbi:MAG: aminomethyl-transferring glycine dehydrogenase subunit GcvPA [Candidatus Micrarchaeota archaeon]|nr:aminomethyl-transferring glycine dehydrogenase subunit GcvPA [Candidatus Micrarchaeota archaeon]
MNYIPITDQDEKDMLALLGLKNIEELFTHVPAKLNRDLALGEPLSELELKKHLQELSEKNNVLKYFRGAGSYLHYVPSAINHLILRGEFFTAYTPYQPEVSQGTLQAIYEFQTLICALTGMDVANASMYDVATAAAESMLLARSENERNEVVIANPLNPQYLEVLKTYAASCGFVLHEGISKLTDKTSCVIVQQPSYHGSIEDLKQFSDKIHEKGAMLAVIITDPTSLAIIEPPGSFGADIVVGDLQCFGNGLNFGGPSGGFMAVKKQFIKKIPGRLCGMTNDDKGNTGFILTLQAREQHIRREKATSNICTNQALNALASTIYLSLLGKTGLRNVAMKSYHNAHKLQKLLEVSGFKLVDGSKPLSAGQKNADNICHETRDKSFYNEFLVETPVPVKNLNAKLQDHGFLGGVEVAENKWLLCCTEMLDDKDIEKFVETVKSVK